MTIELLTEYWLANINFLTRMSCPVLSGAILCRVSKSFLRFAQLELFAIREVRYVMLTLCPVLSCFVLSCPASSHITSHNLALLHITSPSLTSPRLALSYLILSCPPLYLCRVLHFLAGVWGAYPACQSRVLERVPSPALHPSNEHTEHTAGHRNLLEGPFLSSCLGCLQIMHILLSYQ